MNDQKINNPFLLQLDQQNNINEKNNIPRWPAGPPAETKGEFGAGDKAHQERAKLEGKNIGHPAIDIVYPIGTPIYAMLPGKVINVYHESKPWKPGDPKQGNAVKIDHYNYGLTSFYAHLSSTSVSVGQEVDQNTEIGTVGTSGNAIGTAHNKNNIMYGHVHFQIKNKGVDVNPRSIIKGVPIEKISCNRNIILNFIKEAQLKKKCWEDEDD